MPRACAALFARHDDPATTDAERVQMDAVINHLLGVQMLHRMFVATDVPAQARAMADRPGLAAGGSVALTTEPPHRPGR